MNAGVAKRKITGGCHCGNLRLTLAWPSGEGVGARRCGCTFCRKHGGVWTSHRDASLVISAGAATAMSRYRFGTETAEFLICAVCGVPVAVVSDIDQHLYAVVNVNALEGLDPATLTESATDFDAEDQASRLSRRARNWIPEVTLRLSG